MPVLLTRLDNFTVGPLFHLLLLKAPDSWESTPDKKHLKATLGWERGTVGNTTPWPHGKRLSFVWWLSFGGRGLVCKKGWKLRTAMPPGPNLAWGEAMSSSVSVRDGTSAWRPPVLHSSRACSSRGSSGGFFAVSAQMSPPQARGPPPEHTLCSGLSHTSLFHLLQSKHQFHQLPVIIFPSDYNIHWVSERSSRLSHMRLSYYFLLPWMASLSWDISFSYAMFHGGR